MRACTIVLTAALLGACGGPRLPAPPYRSHPTSALQPVPYPAPPALVEQVPECKVRGAVWLDGEWRYLARQWRWHRGRWVLPLPNTAFSPAAEVRADDGTLYYAQSAWRGADGKEVADPPELVLARGRSSAQVINASGENERVGVQRTPAGLGGGPSASPPPGKAQGTP